MLLPNQALDIDRSQFNLIALRLAQARRAQWRRINPPLRLSRQISKQLVIGHLPSPANQPLQGIIPGTAPATLFV
jgi:hypothetical protein